MRLNFDVNPNGAIEGGSPHRPVSGSLGGFAAFQPGDTIASYAGRIDWGNGAFSTATLAPNGSGGFVVNGSTTYAQSGTYSVRALITHLNDGQTLALNTTAAIGAATNHVQVR